MQAIQGGNTSKLPKTFWIIMSVFTAFFTVYALTHFSIYLDGYRYTCNQYRNTLERLIGVHGTLIPVVHNRLACSSVLDFMDYIQPDTGNAYREGFINTAASLIIGIVMSFFTWILFLFACIYNIRLTRLKSWVRTLLGTQLPYGRSIDQRVILNQGL